MAILEKQIIINIPKPQIDRLIVPIDGTSRLVSHQWSQKAIKSIKRKEGHEPTPKREPKVPQEEYEASLYKAEEGWYGMPAHAFKQAVINACRYTGSVTMVAAKGTIFVEPQGFTSDGVGLIRIRGDKPRMREDMVRVGMSGTEVRYRGEFPKWSAQLPIRYNINIITPDNIYNLFELAGLHSGIGEGRPSAPKKPLDWGMFTVSRGVIKNERKAA